MPRLVHMTWIRSQHRWTKMYKGTRYYISPKELGVEATEAASLLAANSWWESKLLSINGKPLQPLPGTPEAQHSLLEAWAGKPLSSQEETDEAATEMMDVFSRHPMPPNVVEAWLGPQEVTRLENGVDALLNIQTPTDKTVGGLVALWVKTESGRVRVGRSRCSLESRQRSEGPARPEGS